MFFAVACEGGFDYAAERSGSCGAEDWDATTPASEEGGEFLKKTLEKEYICLLVYGCYLFHAGVYIRASLTVGRLVGTLRF